MDQPILREITLGALLDEAVARNPGGDAVVYADRDVRWSYREFLALVDCMAKGLMALGVRRGEKVAVWATNVPHWVVVQFATARIGAVLLTVNTNCRSAELAYLLRHSECENLFLIGGWRDIDYLGAVIYATRRPDPFPRVFGYHEIFHLFVVAARSSSPR